MEAEAVVRASALCVAVGGKRADDEGPQGCQIWAELQSGRASGDTTRIRSASAEADTEAAAEACMEINNRAIRDYRSDKRTGGYCKDVVSPRPRTTASRNRTRTRPKI